MGRGDRLAVACVVLIALDTLLFALLALLVIVSTIIHPETADACEFDHAPKDRPVLETVHQVWEAQTTGISEFEFDGVHYIVKDLPKEYVKYSSWYCRMP